MDSISSFSDHVNNCHSLVKFEINGVIDMDDQFSNEYLQLGLKIAYYPKLRGLTQEELAEKIDRSATFIGHVEAPNVRKTVSLGTLFAITRALNVPVYKFFIFED